MHGYAATPDGKIVDRHGREVGFGRLNGDELEVFMGGRLVSRQSVQAIERRTQAQARSRVPKPSVKPAARPAPPIRSAEQIKRDQDAEALRVAAERAGLDFGWVLAIAQRDGLQVAPERIERLGSGAVLSEQARKNWGIRK